MVDQEVYLAMRCIVWGTGKFGRGIKNLLEENGIEIIAYGDNNPRFLGNCIMGIPIYPLDIIKDLFENDKIDCILIATMQEKDSLEIIQQLYNCGITKIKRLPQWLLYEEVSVQESFFTQMQDISELKPYLNYLTVHLYEQCNLNCKGCSHLTNIIIDDDLYPEIDRFGNDLRQLKKFFCGVERIDLLGGEPLLNNNLANYIEVTREVFEDADIHVVSNGLLVCNITEQLLQVLRQENVILDITSYPPTMQKKANIVRFLTRNSISFVFSEEIEYFRKSLTVEDHGMEHATNLFHNCIARNCHMLKNGSLYQCAGECVVEKFNIKFDTHINEDSEDFIDLYKFGGMGWDINRQFTTPCNLCRWCSDRNVFFKWEQGMSGEAKKEDWLV